MKTITLASLVSLAYAAPATLQERALIERQATINEFTKGSGNCKSATMIYARGSVEPGNVGQIIGPPLFTAIKKLYPDITIQGVEYAAGLFTNMNSGNADTKGIDNATKLFNDVSSKCPKTIIVAGGYSQGAAVMHRSIEKLPKNIQDRIAAVALYGDTLNKKENAQIKNFPKEKAKVFCMESDGVCGDWVGIPNVTIGHLTYSSAMIDSGAKWVVDQIKGYKPGSSGSSGSSASSAPSTSSSAAPKSSAPKGTPRPPPTSSSSASSSASSSSASSSSSAKATATTTKAPAASSSATSSSATATATA